MDRILTFVNLLPSSFVVRITESIMPLSECLTWVEQSLRGFNILAAAALEEVATSSLPVYFIKEVLPIIMSSPLTIEPGVIIPSTSSLS
jgi:hypothetical protein